MIYTEKTKLAMKIAYDAHHGQINKKSGEPYIYHPIHLAEQMETEEETIVALLHDVVEDTDIKLEQLAKDFSSVVIEALELLTHDDSVEYMDYVRKLKPNLISRKVKLADLQHNTDITSLDKVTEKDLKRIEKYKEAIQILSDEN